MQISSYVLPQKAIYTHIDILWGLYGVHDVPRTLSQEMLDAFHSAISSANEIMLNRSQAIGDTSIISVARLPQDNIHLLKKNLLGIEEVYCEMMRQSCARHGLSLWCPDLRKSSPPYGLWNSACRVVFLDSFRQLATSEAWPQFAPNLSHLQNTVLVLRIYDHYVHYYQTRRFIMEARNPGSVLVAELKSTNYSRRRRVCLCCTVWDKYLICFSKRAAERLDFLTANRYPRRYRVLATRKATSDDEYDPQTGQWIATKKQGRSQAAEVFYRRLDQKQQRAKLLASGRRELQSHSRVFLDARPLSTLEQLPAMLPVDYYDPAFFNDLPFKQRSRCATKSAAFPSSIDDILHADERDKKPIPLDIQQATLRNYRFPEENMLEDEDDGADADDEDEGAPWLGNPSDGLGGLAEMELDEARDNFVNMVTD